MTRPASQNHITSQEIIATRDASSPTWLCKTGVSMTNAAATLSFDLGVSMTKTAECHGRFWICCYYPCLLSFYINAHRMLVCPLGSHRQKIQAEPQPRSALLSSLDRGYPRFSPVGAVNGVRRGYPKHIDKSLSSRASILERTAMRFSEKAGFKKRKK